MKKTEIIQWLKIKRLEVFFIAILITILGSIQVGNTAKINYLLYEIDKRDQELINIKVNIQLLESEVIKLKSAERIIPIAENKLGLIITASVPLVVLDTTSD